MALVAAPSGEKSAQGIFHGRVAQRQQPLELRHLKGRLCLHPKGREASMALSPPQISLTLQAACKPALKGPLEVRHQLEDHLLVGLERRKA